VTSAVTWECLQRKVFLRKEISSQGKIICKKWVKFMTFSELKYCTNWANEVNGAYFFKNFSSFFGPKFSSPRQISSKH
jgi:hypothetical protein